MKFINNYDLDVKSNFLNNILVEINLENNN